MQDRKKIEVNKPAEYARLNESYATLLNRITQYYGYRNPLHLPAESTQSTSDPDVLIFPSNEPLLWFSLAQKYIPELKDSGVVFIPGIHIAAVHTHEWNRICNLPTVLMTIDLYEAGLLIFKDEFKEKQHFVLKYPFTS